MLYIGADDGIYRWFRGASWPVFHSLQGRSIVGLASPGGGVLVALDAAAKVWESVNNGIDWRSIPLPDSAGRPASIALLNGSEIVVATGRPIGLMRRPIGLPAETDAPGTLDRARLWEDRIINRAASLAQKVRRRDGTATLKRPAAATTEKTYGWTAMAIPENGDVVAPAVRLVTSHEGTAFAAIAGAGLWSSSDLGATWARVAGLPSEVYSLRFAPNGVMAAGTGDGVWLSGDGGASWADSSAGLENARQVRAVAIKPGDPKTLLAGCAPVGAGQWPGGRPRRGSFRAL